jgi:hypothetical protein
MSGKAWLCWMGVIGLFAAGQAALAEDYEASSGQSLALAIRSTEPEVDALIDATCVAANTIDIRIGGELPLGKGDHKPTSLTLSDGTLSARIDGLSVASPDVEMTGGSMLLTSVEPQGKVMQILSSGKPITLRPPDKSTHKLALGKSVTAAVKEFVKKCENGEN